MRQNTDKKPLWDHCGITAAFAKDDIAFFQTGVRGLSLLQTRGYDGAGFWAQDTGGRVFHYKGIGMVNEVFSPEISHLYHQTKARVWVYQVRYGTSGDYKSRNVQPLLATHLPTGQQFVVAHNGQFSKPQKTVENIKSDTVQFTEELSRMNGPGWDQRIIKILSEKKGAWSLVVGTREALYVARDPYGFRPLVYGHVWDEVNKQYFWVVASETSSLEAMGVSEFVEILPGTIGKFSKSGFKILAQIKNQPKALCIFENIYIQHGSGKAHLPRSSTTAINQSPTIDEVRRRSGKILAREAPLTIHDVDMVIGVPGTGIEGGMAYARALNLPYFQAITDRVSSSYEQRTFMTANVSSIYQKVLDHFNFDRQSINGRRLALVDDSIVRGNITKGLVELLKDEYHVEAIHLRILCPPIDKACHLGVNTRTQEELIAVRQHNNVESIRSEIGADSLAYLSATGLKESLVNNARASGFCLGCMAGHQYPIDAYGNPPISKTKNGLRVEKYIARGQLKA